MQHRYQRWLSSLVMGLVLPSMATASGCDDGGSGDGTTDTTVATDTAPGDTSAPGDTAVPVDTTPPAPSCTDDTECAGETGKPLCDVRGGTCVALPRGHQIGWRDGVASSVTLNSLVSWNQPFEATDLEFHPTRDELWVVNRVFEVRGTCSESNPWSARCGSMAGFVTVIYEPGTDNQSVEIHEDGNAPHFMRRPPAMAMGAKETWATCGEATTGNYEDEPTQFIGPTLWSSDLKIFGPGPPAGNGSHLDMLHATPFCMGIAHERGNIYWLFNGNVGSIDRYDFKKDHGPGNDDHSDGEISRYVEGQLSRVPGVPSHMAFNDADDHLYIADTGNGRIVKLDTKSGSLGGAIVPNHDEVATAMVNGATLTEVVKPGVLTQPSGLAIHDGLIFVTDAATSTFHAFELDGTHVRSQDTTFPAGTLAGLTVGRDDAVYFTHMGTGEVYRLEPK